MKKKIIFGLLALALAISAPLAFAREEESGDDSRGRDRIERTSTSTIKENRGKNLRAASSTDIACISLAVGKREDAIAKSWGDFDDRITESLTDRKAALISAWSLTDKEARKPAVKKAWSDAKNDRKEAASTYKTEKKTIWSTFKKEAKACGGSAGSEASGESESGEKVEI